MLQVSCRVPSAAPITTTTKASLESSLKVQFKFNEGNSVLVDNVEPNINYLTIVNSVTDDERGICAEFKSSDDNSSIEFPIKVNPISSDMCITYWMKSSDVKVSSDIFSFFDTNGPLGVAKLSNNLNFGKQTIKFDLFDFKRQESINTNVNLSDDKWHHVAINFSNKASTYEFYIDGTKVNVNPSSITIENFQTFNKFFIGYNPNLRNQNSYDGKLSDFRIYSRLLTDTEINSVMNETI